MYYSWLCRWWLSWGLKVSAGMLPIRCSVLCVWELPSWFWRDEVKTLRETLTKISSMLLMPPSWRGHCRCFWMFAAHRSSANLCWKQEEERAASLLSGWTPHSLTVNPAEYLLQLTSAHSGIWTFYWGTGRRSSREKEFSVWKQLEWSKTEAPWISSRN